ncbi:MAG: hypothetical protein HQK55_01885 [Deltaproteobacteria bacterium]|nr:hypothetical protein [Deltaproteobacteria bacterium]
MRRKIIPTGKYSEFFCDVKKESSLSGQLRRQIPRLKSLAYRAFALKLTALSVYRMRDVGMASANGDGRLPENRRRMAHF